MQTVLNTNPVKSLGSKVMEAGWKPVSRSGESSVYQCYEKDLGLVAQIWDLVKRIFALFGFEAEGSLDRVKIFDSFEIPRFWSGKRIILIEKTESKPNQTEPESKKTELSPLAEIVLSPIPRKVELPRYFLEQVSDIWTVRDPSEERKFTTPGKSDATSRMRVNAELAQKQQKEKESKVKSQEERKQAFIKFLEDFHIKATVIKTVRKTNCPVNTEMDKVTKSMVFKLQNFDYGISSSISSQNEMEDAHAVFELNGHPCFAVFDGYEGPEDADYCASHMSRVLEGYLKQSDKPLAELNDAELILFFKKAFIILDKEVDSFKLDKLQKIPARLKVTIKPRGTTVALNVIIGDRIVCVNLGNSRTVVINKNKEANQISLAAGCELAKYAKKVLSKHGVITDNKVNGTLVVPRLIGGCGLHHCVSPVPTLSNFTFGEYMIVASKGLWDVVTPLEAGELLAMMKDRGYDVDAMSQALVKLALKRCVKDNVSVIVVKKVTR